MSPTASVSAEDHNYNKTKENLDNPVLELLHRVVVGDIADVSHVLLPPSSRSRYAGWRHHIPLKHRKYCPQPHGVTTQRQ